MAKIKTKPKNNPRAPKKLHKFIINDYGSLVEIDQGTLHAWRKVVAKLPASQNPLRSIQPGHILKPNMKAACKFRHCDLDVEWEWR